MTPYLCAKEIAECIQQMLSESEERMPMATDGMGCAMSDVHVFTGFVPIPFSKDDRQKYAPSITVRPEEITEGTAGTTITISLSVITYDGDKRNGCEGLYHLLEFMRRRLLERHFLGKHRFPLERETMKTSIPDDQPWPCWWGIIQFDVDMPYPTEVGINYDEF